MRNNKKILRMTTNQPTSLPQSEGPQLHADEFESAKKDATSEQDMRP